MRAVSRIAVVYLLLALPAAAQAQPAGPAASWESQANSICKKAVAKINKLPEPKTRAELIGAYRKLMAITAAEVADLRRLREPAAKAKAIATMYGHVDAGLAALRKAVAALGRDDESGFKRQLAAANAQFSVANKLALRLGAPECAK